MRGGIGHSGYSTEATDTHTLASNFGSSKNPSGMASLAEPLTLYRKRRPQIIQIKEYENATRVYTSRKLRPH